ncbi:NAD-dependent epimerase/dehydratase family protein [Flavobacterium rhamnosiphilum]|uniref:NAD-dependent epimerase/dehydratase family protein n=1 Tax=Flavobacterium rhamnosiphilum TaxID=2541724 RepID=A0A4R5F2I5_9FLAO|nr:SDR family oxidoreductase [Flavobacterium rhamnosiphilum]TDE41675.1 NAD-dependent epimerase/dehydratase family protein [Flavobacterium rhamnosiphilum]
MKIILTGATGVLGSQIMYEILELFIKESIDGKLILISRSKGKKTALDRINDLLSSSYTPQILKDQGLEKLDQYIEIIDTDLDAVQENFSSKIDGAYFIHSAGYVNLSTDEQHREKIFDENTKITKVILNNFHHLIKKFIYIGTAFSSGERTGIVENDFHNLDFVLKHRNAYENAKFHSESFVAQKCRDLGLPFQILRPSVICGKMLGNENKYFISKYMVFYLLAKFFHFAAQRKTEQENVRFMINEKTGLNIIPVDYVAKVIVSVFRRDDIQQLNIVSHKSLNLVKGLELIMKEVGYTNYTIIENAPHFEYQNTTEKLYYESIGKHLKPYLVSSAKQFNTTLLNSILEIPKLDDETFTNLIRYARLNNFKDVNV